MDISPSKVQVTLAVTTSWNASKELKIKGFRAATAGNVIYTDADSTSHTVAMNKGEVLPIQGAVSIDATNPTALLIFL